MIRGQMWCTSPVIDSLAIRTDESQARLITEADELVAGVAMAVLGTVGNQVNIVIDARPVELCDGATATYLLVERLALPFAWPLAVRVAHSWSAIYLLNLILHTAGEEHSQPCALVVGSELRDGHETVASLRAFAFVALPGPSFSSPHLMEVKATGDPLEPEDLPPANGMFVLADQLAGNLEGVDEAGSSEKMARHALERDGQGEPG